MTRRKKDELIDHVMNLGLQSLESNYSGTSLELVVPGGRGFHAPQALRKSPDRPIVTLGEVR